MILEPCVTRLQAAGIDPLPEGYYGGFQTREEIRERVLDSIDVARDCFYTPTSQHSLLNGIRTRHKHIGWGPVLFIAGLLPHLLHLIQQ